MDGLDLLAVRAAALRVKMAEDVPQSPIGDTAMGGAGKAPLYGGIRTGILSYKPPVPKVPQRELGYREQARTSITNKASTMLRNWWDRMRARYSNFGGGRNAG